MPQRIVVVRANNIGDVLLAVPALRALRRARPSADVSLRSTGHATPSWRRGSPCHPCGGEPCILRVPTPAVVEAAADVLAATGVRTGTDASRSAPSPTSAR